MAISMQSREVDHVKEREPQWFEIDMLRCIYCGYCEEVCPEEAIVMSKEYDLTFQARGEAIFGLDRLLVPKERLKDRLAFLENYKNQQVGEHWDHRKDNNIHSVKDQHFLNWLADEGLREVETVAAAQDPVAEDQDWGGERHGPPVGGHPSA